VCCWDKGCCSEKKVSDVEFEDLDGVSTVHVVVQGPSGHMSSHAVGNVVVGKRVVWSPYVYSFLFLRVRLCTPFLFDGLAIHSPSPHSIYLPGNDPKAMSSVPAVSAPSATTPPAISDAPDNTRATSLDQLAKEAPAGSAGPSDTELVNDILNEIQQQQQRQHQASESSTAVQPPLSTPNDRVGGMIAANSAGLQQHTNDTAFARQVDPSINHDISPSATGTLVKEGCRDSHQLSERDGALSRTLEAAAAKSESDETSLAAASPSPSSIATAEAHATTTTQSSNSSLFSSFSGILSRFDIITFVKTFVLCALLFAFATHARVQALFSRIPYMASAGACSAVMERGGAGGALLTVAGQGVLAVLFGTLVASVQQVV
jgi:hypothetical protein